MCWLSFAARHKVIGQLWEGVAMRIWLWAIVAAGLAGAVSWGGSAALVAGARTGFAEIAAQGQGSVEDVSAKGFPLAIGARAQGVRLTDPAQGFAWTIPELTLSAPLWAPLTWRVDLSALQDITVGGVPFTLTTDQAFARVSFGAGRDLPLRGGAVRITNASLEMVVASIPSFSVTAFELVAQAGDAEGRYQITGGAEALTLPPQLIATLAPQAGFPATVEQVSVAGQLGFSEPLAVLKDTPPILQVLDLEEVALSWGGHRLAVSGALTLSPAGEPEGTLTLAVSDWQNWLALARGAGLVPQERLPMVQAFAQGLANQSADGVIRVPLSFAGGLMFFAGLPLGPAPRLR
ncbi:DUF2125 domain-containing protein [Rhodobacter aestuarii]|nr:DUF2125 domain-containing protein [Rhodobacter aestuarii]